MIEYVVILVPVVAFVIAYLLSSSPAYEFDPPNSSGAFMGVYAHFSRLFYFIFVASLVGSFVALGYIRDDHAPAAMLLASSIYALLFNGFAMLYYEAYLHVRYATGRSNYTKLRYSFIMTLGFSAVLLFVLGLVSGFAAL